MTYGIRITTPEELAALPHPHAWLCDMDGVLIRENLVLPGAKEFISALESSGTPYLVLTNNSIFTRRDLSARLATSGLDIPEERIWTSAVATADFLASQSHGGSAYVIGEAGLTTALHQQGDQLLGVLHRSAQILHGAPRVFQVGLGQAKRAANGRIDTERYYRKLWELTGDLVVRQISDAASHLSSLWYTAWVDAGQPAIPEPFDELPTVSVFSGVGIEPTAEGGPVGARSAQNRKFNLIIWSVMAGFALLAAGSSLVRILRNRKAPAK